MNKYYIGDTFVLGSNTNNPNVSIVGVNMPELQEIQTTTSLISPLTTTSNNTITGSGLNFTSLTAGRIAIMPPKSLFYALYSNSTGITVSGAQALANWTSTLSTTSDLGASQSTGAVTVETTGYYRLYAKVWFNTSTATSRNILFYINGSSTVYRNSSISQGQTSCEIDVVLYITSTNVIYLYASANGASANVINYVYSVEKLY